MSKEVCPICKEELKTAPIVVASNKNNVPITQYYCEEHGTIKAEGKVYEK